MSKTNVAAPRNLGVVLAIDFDLPIFQQSSVYRNDPCVRFVSSEEVAKKEFRLPDHCTTTVVFWQKYDPELAGQLARKAKRAGLVLEFKTAIPGDAQLILGPYWSWNFRPPKPRPAPLQEPTEVRDRPGMDKTPRMRKVHNLAELESVYGIDFQAPINDEVLRILDIGAENDLHLILSKVRMYLRRRRQELHIVPRRLTEHTIFIRGGMENSGKSPESTEVAATEETGVAEGSSNVKPETPHRTRNRQLTARIRELDEALGFIADDLDNSNPRTVADAIKLFGHQISDLYARFAPFNEGQRLNGVRLDEKINHLRVTLQSLRREVVGDHPQRLTRIETTVEEAFRSLGL